MGQTIGIDLGTTYSAAAVMDATGTPKILTNQDGEPVTPSVVLFQNFGQGDEPLVGVQAKNMATAAPDDVVQYVKRQIGDPDWRFDSSTGQSYTAEEISAIILRRIKAGAEAALGAPVDNAVITVPAYFDDARRVATRQAGEMAGLNVLRVLNEPTSAALSYGLESKDAQTVLVYDLGGGTFDVTVLKIDHGNFDVIGTDGDRNLGGFDFDNQIALLLADALTDQGAMIALEDTTTLALLREKAEQAKRALSSVDKTSVHLSHQGRQFRVNLTRHQFEERCADLLKRTEEIAEDVLSDAGMRWADVDQVLMIGGSTRMPMVPALLERLTGTKPVHHVNPDEAVALGAAIQAAMEMTLEPMAYDGADATSGLSGSISISDVTSQALGVLALDDRHELANFTVIPRNAKIPARGTESLVTTGPRTDLRIEVTQGDDNNPDFVTKIGEGILQLKAPVDTGYAFNVTYHYDIDQTVFVEVNDAGTGALIGTFDIDRESNLNEDQVHHNRRKLESLNIE